VLCIGVVVIGVTDRERAAEFWSAALGYRRHPQGFGGWSVVLEPPDGTGAALALQVSDTDPAARPRIHLDLHVMDAAEQDLEVARLTRLGAGRVDWEDYPEDPDFVVLSDTEGNLFCVVNLGHPN